jgi:formylglycine-generating enzyme required for sulfatase activity
VGLVGGAGDRSARRPKGSSDGEWKVVRGGSADDESCDLEMGHRGRRRPHESSEFVGFRIVHTLWAQPGFWVK